MITFVKGDITKASTQVIAHQVNCNGVMGAGVARAMRRAFPEIYAPYKSLCKELGAMMLGNVQAITVSTGQVVVNLFGQEGYGTMVQQTDYKALQLALMHLRELSINSGWKSLALPYRIGCGLGGGDWEIVGGMIRSIFHNFNGLVVIYEL